MACGAAFDDAVRVAQQQPTLDIGCHVVLVDGAPLAPPGTISSLLSSSGTFHESLPCFLLDLQRGRIREVDIETEATAQIRALQRAGIGVSHVDTHKHTHLFPRVARPLLRAAAVCGVRAIRNPFEPAWSARVARGALVRRLEVTALRTFHAMFRQLVHDAGIATTDGCIGVSVTGNLDPQSLDTLLTHLPAGTWELVCHPGYDDDALRAIRTRLTTTREVERSALHHAIPAAVAQQQIALGTFAGL